MALKISLLLDREFDGYSHQLRINKECFSEIGRNDKNEIVRIQRLVERYKRYKNKKDLQKFLQDFEADYDSEEIYKPKCKLTNRITFGELKRIRERLKEHRILQELT